jgi:peptide-methionine (R)-S-oxide reductase
MAGKAYAVTHSDAEWRQILTPDQYDVMRAHGTEAPGSCALLLEKRPGRFSCAGCGQPLFDLTPARSISCSVAGPGSQQLV